MQITLCLAFRNTCTTIQESKLPFCRGALLQFLFCPKLFRNNKSVISSWSWGIKDMYFENQIEQNSFETVSKLLQSSIRYRAFQSFKISSFVKRLKWVLQKWFPKSRSKINFPSDFSKHIRRWIWKNFISTKKKLDQIESENNLPQLFWKNSESDSKIIDAIALENYLPKWLVETISKVFWEILFQSNFEKLLFKTILNNYF